MQKHLFIFILLVLGFLSCQPSQKPAFQSSVKHELDSTISADSEIEAEIIPLRDSVESIMNEVIGKSVSNLYPEKPESPLSNFVSDLLLDAARKEIKKTRKEDLPVITVINIKGLRSSLPKGPVKVENIYSLMPFENQLVILKLSGRSIFKLFKHIGESNGDGLAGASFTYSNGEIKNAKINGQDIDDQQKYYVATSDYLAEGGDHYTIFQEAVEKYESPQKIRNLIIKHIRDLTKKGESINPSTNQRINFK
jgi:2',3'-cyclic-nucleotide 2'-phosphodiesterase (5'-nucleotidase family)